MNSVWISAIGLCGATLIGAVLGFGIKELPHKWNDTVLGYCAGIMLSASTLGLIVPAFDQAGNSGWWMVVIGVMAGALFLNVLDLVTPHLHHITGLDEEEHRNNASLNHILLSDRQLGLGPRRRQHDFAVADDVPECREIRAACETATHADDGDRIIHSQRLYQIKRASWHLGILRNGLMVHIYGKTLTVVTLPMRSVFFSRAVRSGSRAHGRNLTDTVLPTTSSFLMA